MASVYDGRYRAISHLTPRRARCFGPCAVLSSDDLLVLMRSFLLAFLSLLLSSSAVFAQSETAPDDEPTPIQASDLFRIQQLDNVALAPDGRHAVYTARRIVEADDGSHTYRTQLYLTRPDGRMTPQPLTRVADASQPAWHPDSDILAFVRPVDGTPQVFVMRLGSGEPYQLTDHPHGATQPQWADRGRRLLFAASVPGDSLAAQGDSIPDWFEARPGASARTTDYTPPSQERIVLRDTVAYRTLDTLATDVELAGLDLDTDYLNTLEEPTRVDSLRAHAQTRRAIADTITVEQPASSPSPDGPLPVQRQWLDDRASERNPDVITRLDFQSEFGLRGPISFQHYFVVDLPENVWTSSPKRPEVTRVTEGFRSYSGAQWLNSTGQMIASTRPLDGRHPDDVRARHLVLIDPDTREAERFLALEPYALSNPRLSQDATQLAFTATDTTDTGYAQTEIGLFSMDGRTAPQLITTDFDRSVGTPRWSPNGWYLYTTAASEGGFPLYRFAPFERDTTATDDAPAGPPEVSDSETTFEADSTMMRPIEAERLTGTERGIRSFDVTDAAAVYVVTEVENPYEVYAASADLSSEQQLSRHNASWLENRQISQPESFSLPVETETDTFGMDAWLMRPPNAPDSPAANTHPLMVQMHGGPSAMWGPGEATMWHEFQFMAAQGFAVVYSNPRGSGGYGYDFKRANYRDWGTGPMQDVLDATDRVLADNDDLDASRQVLTGGSYAGYLTAWMVSQTDRFQAAVAQRGVYDLSTFFGEGNAWRLVPSHFGGYPWEGEVPPPVNAASDTVEVYSDSLNTPRSTLIRNSPQTYVDQIDTPLLIMHASNDLRTGVIQSEVLYRSLKVLGRPVEYVRYPDAGHDLSRTGDPDQRLDRTLRIYEFMTRFTGDNAAREGAGDE